MIEKEEYIEWLKALRDNCEDETIKDVYNALIVDTEKLW